MLQSMMLLSYIGISCIKKARNVALWSWKAPMGARCRIYVLGVLALYAARVDASEVRRIAPDRFPELRLQGEERQVAVPTMPPSQERPQAHCERTRSDWIFCLQGSVRTAESMLQETMSRIEGVVGSLEGASPYQREAFQRALREADRRFRALRDHECQALVLSEPKITGQLFEARLLCQIDRNLERIATLRQRYEMPP